MAGLHFDITGDNSNFMRKLQETESGVKSTSKQIEESGMSVEQMFSRMTKAAAAFGAGFSAQQLVSQITKVRGEFQQLEVAFNTMLGSKEQADTLMSQLVRTAAITPFDLQGVANGAKQLLAYGTAAEDVNGTLVRLGDIAAGLSIPLNDLVWLYGTTMTQGRLFTQDLRQFQGRGIPLADELAEQFGVAKDKVGELVTAGKVGFPEVQKAIEAMTNEGSKFGGLMEDQSKTITGQISNIEDAIATMFNQIGKENESVINSALSGVSYLVEHWNEVAIAIESAAIAYGTYKAAVMTTAALQGAEQTLKIDAEIEGLKSLLVVKEQSKNADLEAAVASGTLTEAKAVQLVSLREELATRLTVLKLKEEEAIAEQASALSAFNTAKKASYAANERLEKMDALYQAALAQGDASYELYTMEQLQTASANANTAATNLNTAEKNLNAASFKRKAASEAVDTMATQANTIANHANTASMNIMKLAAIQLTNIIKGMWATLMANPLFLIAGALTGLAFVIYKVATAENEAEKATRMYNEALEEQQKQHDEYKKKIDSLIKAVDDNNKSEGERLQAFEALKAEYPTVLSNLLTEAEYLREVHKYKKLIAEEDNKRAKQSDEELLEEAKRKLKQYQDVRKNGSSTSLVDMDGNGWASDNVEDAIKAQLEIVNKAIAKVASHNVTSYLGNIKNLEDSEIISVIDGINTSLKALGKSGDDAIAIVSELGGEFSKSQLSSIKNALETEQKARSGEKNTGKGWIEKYKKGYLDAQKELNDFLNTQSALSEIEYEKKLKELTDQKNEAEKKYKSVGGLTGSSLSKQESAAEKQQEAIRAQNDKLMSLESKQALERQRQQQDLQNQLAQSTIDALSDGYDKEKAQRDLNNKKEIQSLNRQKDDYIRAYVQAQKEIFDAGEELKAKKTKGYTKQTFDSSTINMDEIIATWDKIIKNTETKQGVDEWQRREDAMNEYLIEYGTFAQKKEAIDKKYRAAIDKEVDLGKKNSLQKEWDEALTNLDLSKLKQEINWEMVFGDLSKVTKDQLTNIKKQLQEFKKFPEFQNATPEQIQVIEGAINSINDAMVDKGGFFGGMVDSIKELKIATEELKKAEEELAEANRKGTEAEKEEARKKVNQAKNRQQNAETNVTRSSDKTIDNITRVGSAIAQLGSDAEMSLSSFGNAAGNIVDAFTEAGSKIGGIVGAIFSILEGVQKQGLDGFVKNIIGNVAGAVGGIFDTLTFGAFGLSGADYSHYNDMVEEYTNLNKIWDELIDKKKEYIDMSYGAEANKVGREALELVEKSIESYRILGKERLNAGASAGSHSIGVRIRKGMSTQGWNEAKAVLGNAFNEKSIGDGRMTGLFDLSVEQLEKLKYEAPTFWAKLDGDVADYLNNIIEGEARLEDIQNQVKEQLTQTTFDTVFSSFVDTLMDMDSSAKDFSNSFSEYMQRAMLTTMVGDKFSDELQKWYDAFAKANDDKDGITKEEMDALKSQYDAIVNSALSEREKLAEIFGWTNEDAANYENFISNMQSAFTSLDVTAKDVSNNIYDYFRQAMINALYEKEYKGKMEELYKSFTELSKDGLSEGDMAKLGSQVDQYIEQMMKGVEDVNGLFAEKLKDAEDLQSFVDNVKSAMSSIEATAEDVTDNIFEYIRQQMIDKMFADTFQPQIEAFYKKVQAAMSDGDVTDAERDALRSEAEKLANDIVAAKDILSGTLGITENNLKKDLEEEFKSFSDGILNSLTSAEVTAEAVAKNISESMRKELIEAMYIEQYEPRIKAIWEKWKEYSEDGLVTDEERANIKNDIDELSKEVADAAGEISDAWKDSGEEVKKAFDSFSDSIKSVLYDAETTAEDVANNIYKFMRNALVDSMFAAQLQPQIQAWYDQYTKFMEDGAIDTVERKTLDEMIAEIQKAGMEIVDAVNGLFPSLDTGAIKRAEEAAQEAENARNEAEQEWESFSDDILNSLYDIEATAEDISDDMGEYMRKALIKAMYVENFKPQMQKWYNAWKSAMGDDDLTSEEKQMLDSMKQTMVDDMKKEVDAINQFFGSMFSQQASSKGYETISQDTGDEISGRLTGVYESSEGIRAESAVTNDWLGIIYSAMKGVDYRFIPSSSTSQNSDIKDSIVSMITSVNSLVVSSTDNNNVLNEIRNIMLLSNGYLEDVSIYTKKILDEFGSRLISIDRNIQNL